MDYASIKPSAIRSELRRRQLRQADIASAIGCNQAQVSRLLSGEDGHNTKTYRAICEFVFDKSGDEREAGERILANALDDCWDGSTRQARSIADVLRALGTLTKPRANHNGQ